MKVDRVQHRAKPKDDVGPALAAGRAMVEFAHLGAMRRFRRELLPNAPGRQSVEYAELALAKPLVDDGRLRSAGQAAGIADRLRSLTRADIGRRQQNFRLFVLRQARRTSGRRPRPADDRDRSAARRRRGCRDR